VGWKDYGPKIRYLTLVIRAILEKERTQETAITILAKVREREVFHLVDQFIAVLLKTERIATATIQIIVQITTEIEVRAEKEISDS
jgi:predicted choloylglycine hydrolase